MNNSRRRARKFLTEDGIVRVVRAIESLSVTTALTWEDVKRLASEHAGDGYVWTRQALEKHRQIKDAYLSHESARRRHAKSGNRTSGRLSEPQRLARLEAEVEALRATLNQYDQRFATYLANAVAHGMTVQQLSAPLRPPSRGGGNSDAT